MTEKVEPQYNLPQPQFPPLERAIGAEVGLRTAIIPHLQNELTVWYLHLAYEQIFDGDRGTTSPSYPSHRYGVESANYYTPFHWLTFDADIAYSVAHFIGCQHRPSCDPAGDHIPGSPTWVVSARRRLDDIHGFFASVRMHYFGPARTSTTARSVRHEHHRQRARRLQIPFQACQRLATVVDVFNVLDNKTRTSTTTMSPGFPESLRRASTTSTPTRPIHSSPSDIEGGVLMSFEFTMKKLPRRRCAVGAFGWLPTPAAATTAAVNLQRAAPSGTGAGTILTLTTERDPDGQTSGTTQELNNVTFGGCNGRVSSSPSARPAPFSPRPMQSIGRPASPTPLDLYGVVYGAQFIAVGGDDFAGAGVVLNGTPDGMTWTLDAIFGTSACPLTGVTFANNQFVAVGDNQVMSSPDGVTWNALPTEPSGITSHTVDLFNTAYGNNLFVTVGTYNHSTSTQEIAYLGLIATSTDANTWSILPYTQLPFRRHLRRGPVCCRRTRGFDPDFE